VVQETYARTAPSRRVLIRYEEMRDEPIGALERICDMLGIEATRDRLEAIAAANAFSAVPHAQKGAGREIRRAEPGGWAAHMSRQEIIEMHEILAAKLDELGYLRPGDIPTRKRAA
jgi:Sulfotransferase domain